MKRISFLLVFTALMVFSFGLVHGQSEVVLDVVEGLFGSATSDTVEIDTPLKFTFRLTQNTGDSLFAFTHGFQVYTKLSDANPATSGYFDAPFLDTLPIGPSGWFYHSIFNPNGHFDDIIFQQFSLDGLGRDTTAVSVVWTTGNAPGFETGYSEQVWYIATQGHTNGDTLCIDSSFFPPGGAWLWSLSAGTPPTLSPDWYGPYCYHIYDPTVVQANLVVSPPVLYFGAIEGGSNPANRTFNIGSDGNPLDFTLSNHEGWLSTVPSVGTTDATIQVSVNISGLSAGIYLDTITVVSPTASNSPQYVEVNLVVIPAGGVNEIVLDDVTNILGSPTSDTIEAGGITRFTFRLTNTAGLDTIYGMSNGFEVYEKNGGNYYPITGDTLASVGFKNRFDLGFWIQTYSATGSGCDTIGFGGAAMSGSGIGYSFSEPVWWIETGSDNGGDTLCIDSSFFPPSGTWVWGVKSDGIIVPDWGGPYCFHVEQAPSPPQYLYITPNILYFTAAEGGANPDSQAFNVIEIGGAVIPFAVSETSSWFDLNKSGGTTPDSVYVTVDISSLVAGHYHDTVVVSSGEAANSPQLVFIDLIVTGGCGGDEYYVFADFDVDGYACEGYWIDDTTGHLYVDNGGDCYVYLVSIPAGSDPDQHPDNPWNPGPMAPRTLTLIETYDFSADCGWSGSHHAEFYVNDNYIYYGPDDYGAGGIEKWYKNPDGTFGAYIGREPIPVPPSNGETFGYDAINHVWYTCTRGRDVYSFEAGVDVAWQYEFTYPSYAGSHHDGLEFVGGYLWVSDMTSDSIGQWLDSSGIWIEKHRFGYSHPSPVEGMGYGPMGHFWVTSGTSLYEIGGGWIGFVVPGIPDQCIHMGESFQSFDLDDHAVGVPPITWSWSGNTDITITKDSENVVTLTYPEGWCGYEKVTFTVTDGCGRTAQTTPVFAVLPEHFVLDIPNQNAPFESFDLDDYVDTSCGIDPAKIVWSYSGNTFFVVDIDPVTHLATVTNPLDSTRPETITFTAQYLCAENSDEATFAPVPGITPTYEWINIYCDKPHLNGVSLAPGDVITAYDPDGVLCGMDVVRADGSFGFMPIYRDDIYSAADEGADPCDIITLMINGEEVYPDPLVIWTSNGDEFQVCEFSTCVYIHLHKGWNLISWNVTYSAGIDEIMAQLGKCTCVEVILGFDQGALTYDPDLPEFSTLLDVDYYHGYWFKMNCDAMLEICGPPIDPRESIVIYSGWNLVSYWPNETLSVEDGFASILDNLLVALGYDYGGLTWLPGDTLFNTLKELKPLFGYWAKSSADDVLVYPGFIAPPFATTKDQDGSQIAATAVISSRAWVSLYGAGITLDGMELTSGSAIEAYTKDGVRCGSSHYGDGLLKFSPVYGYDPLGEVTANYPKDGDAVTLYVDGSRVYPDVEWADHSSRVRIDNLFSTAAGTGILPDDYALMQNYPNPFNPATEIAFNLPTAGHATLEIFNVLGQRVTTLTDGVLDAGEHVLIWDGTDADGNAVSSGIYLYRLQAGDFVDTKKMMLVK